jgi:hypothetical protein
LENIDADLNYINPGVEICNHFKDQRAFARTAIPVYRCERIKSKTLIGVKPLQKTIITSTGAD